MAMDLNAKAAYIRGLMTGMDFDADSKNGKVIAAMMDPVSYTHLTLPTIYSVEISGVAVSLKKKKQK